MQANPPYERAMGLLAAEQYADAIPLFDAGLELEPGRARIHSNRGFALQQLGRLDEARSNVARGVELRGADPYPLVMAARVLRVQDDLAGARVHAESAWDERANLELDYVGEVVEIMAYAMNNEGVWRAALRVVDEALVLMPERTSLIATRATTLAVGDRWGEAMREITRALTLAPADAFLLERAQTITKGLAVAATCEGPAAE